jgi:predicted Zn-dependent protease
LSAQPGVNVFNLAISLGAALFLAIILKWPLSVSLWIGIPLGLVAGTAIFIYLGKKVQEKLETVFKRASEQFKHQQWEPAIETMRGGYKFAPWQFLVKGSIDGQIGTIQYLRNKHTEAEPLLKSASMNHYIAKAMLAILQWKRGERALAKKTFDLAIKAGKKESLLYAVYAYVLNEMRERDAAIKMLNQGMKYCKDDDRLLSNRTLLQNKKPMKMKIYGEQWYQFMLERPVIRQEPPPFARISKRQLRG